MSIKTKKIKLTKILIGSSLLLATTGLPFALTSCGKKGTSDGDSDKHSTSYLFKLEPKVFDKDGKEVNDNLVLENTTKELLDKTKGYNEKFLSQLDLSFENHKFEEKDKNNENNYNDITANLGDITVYYLNTNNLDSSIAFDINEQMLSKCSKIDEVKKYISFKSLSKQKVQNDEKPKLVVESLDEKNLSFLGKDNDKDIEIGEDVSKIKKAKITFPVDISASLKEDGLCGLLITFNPIDGDEKVKTIVVKFVQNDDEFKYLNPKSYDDFNKDIEDIDEMVKDYYVVVDSIGSKKLDQYITDKMNEEKSDVDLSKIATKTSDQSNNEKWNFNSGDFFGTNSKKLLSDLKNYLEKILFIVLDEEKSKDNATLCFDASSLLNNKDYHYVLCFKKKKNGDTNFKSFKSEDISIHYGEKEAKDGKFNTYDIHIEETEKADIKDGKFVVKYVVKQLNLDFISKKFDLLIAFKK